MEFLDYAVLAVYFMVMTGIGVACMKLVKAQEDYFMGGRGFGKLLQTFAAFGAGTGSSDPVNAARTTFTGGLSGMWSVMYWLFVTPIYWIVAVWYRRMRLLTLGDWFAERYDSKALGAAYSLAGLLFMVVYGSMLFSAIGKVAAPLVNTGTVGGVDLEYILVPVIALFVLFYGIAGGLRAAYWTDLIQGVCIILLSIMLIPYGLQALVEKFGDPSTQGMMDGFRIIHEQLPPEYFSLVATTGAGDFPLLFLVVVVIMNMLGIVVQPHFIAMGGGSAKTENNARVGLVVGNFLKRFCTLGWVLTALIALALFADSHELADDPDKTWGIAARELLGPGLTGLMLACLLAALMSSVDAHMIIGSALVVRNLYAAYINPAASERTYVMVGRLTGASIVVAAVIVSLTMMDVFKQLELTWRVPLLVAAPFWLGMYWRRATSAATWATIIFCLLAFFVIPWVAPVVIPGLRTNQRFTRTNDVVITTTTRQAAPSDVARSEAAIRLWKQRHEEILNSVDPSKREVTLQELGPQPVQRILGEDFTESTREGGQPVYWSIKKVTPIDADSNPLSDVAPQTVDIVQVDERVTRVIQRYPPDVRLKASGNFRFDFLLYDMMGLDLTRMSSKTLRVLEQPPIIVTPFLVMFLMSLVTPRNRQQVLDRYYVKMKTPVDPDPEEDQRQMELSYNDPTRFDHRRLFPGTGLEFQKPRVSDVIGFVACVAVCFGIVGLAIWMASIGAGL